MLDLNLNLKIDTDQLTSLLGGKTSSSNSGAFSKVLESASKSFKASQNALSHTSTITKTTKNEDLYFVSPQSEKNKQDMFTSETKSNEKTEQSIKENKNDVEENKTSDATTEENENQETDETQSTEISQIESEVTIGETLEVSNNEVTTEQILLDYKTSSTNNTTRVATNLESTEATTVDNLPTASEQASVKVPETKPKETTHVATEKHESNSKTSTSSDTDLLTNEQPVDNTRNDNLLDTSLDVQDDSQIDIPLVQSNNDLDVIVKGDVISNLESEIKANTTKNSTSFADSLEEINADAKIEVTAVKFNDTANISDKNYNFNSSSFSDLSNHVTKMSLNKTANFSKIMNEKSTQESQILNQVKDATNALSKGTSKVSIILRPEHLGKVNVNLTSSNGILTAQFVAQSQQTADALNKNLENLKQNLIDQGVKVNDITVKVQETSQSNNFSDNPNFSDDKLNEFKESNSQKNAYKDKKTNGNWDENGNKEEASYFGNSEQNTEEETEKPNNIVNKELEIYNNMGRKL